MSKKVVGREREEAEEEEGEGVILQISRIFTEWDSAMDEAWGFSAIDEVAQDVKAKGVFITPFVLFFKIFLKFSNEEKLF